MRKHPVMETFSFKPHTRTENLGRCHTVHGSVRLQMPTASALCSEKTGQKHLKNANQAKLDLLRVWLLKCSVFNVSTL